MERKQRTRPTGWRVIGCALLFTMTLASFQPAIAVEPVTVFLYDAKSNPLARLEKLSPPLTEGLRAILAMYGAQNRAGCPNDMDETGKLDCVLNTALKAGPQCSDAQLSLVGAWFKSVPEMRGGAAQSNRNVDVGTAGSLKELCQSTLPNTTGNSHSWGRIRVTQDGGEILVDATGDYLYEDETGQFRCKTKYKIEGHSITTLSHDVQVHRKSLRAD